MELDRLKRRINRVKGQTTSPEQLQLHQQKHALTAELDEARARRKALAKQALKVQVSLGRVTTPGQVGSVQFIRSR